MSSARSDATPAEGTSRRSVLAGLTSFSMIGALIGGYGAFAAVATRFLFPARATNTIWAFVSDVKSFPDGESRDFETPSGALVTVARQGRGAGVENFIALSSTCPHLGCQVHWEPHNERFFCPCHNGVFDPSGNGVSGPPGDAGQTLPRYALKVEKDLLYIEVPAESLPRREDVALKAVDRTHPTGPGHDPCLARSAHVRRSRNA